MVQSQTVLSDPLRTRPQLRKAIGGLGFFSLAFGSIIGVGWITALGSWFERAGPVGAIVAFVAGGALMLVIGLCYAEVTPMIPVSGGEVAYTYKAYGRDKAFLIGWFLMFGYLSVSAFEAVSIGKVISFLAPAIDRMPLYEIAGSTVYGSHLLLALLFTAFITAINYFGVAIATRIQILLTFLLLTATAIFVVAGISHGELRNLTSEASTASTFSISGLLAVFVTAPFWFVGFDIIPQAAEEKKDRSPIKRLGLYLALSIIGSAVFYCVVILSAAMTLPWQSLIPADLPTARAFESAFESPVLVNLVLTAGLIGLLTSWNGFFLAGSRVMFALGRGRIIHATFGTTHPRYQTPDKAILFSGIVTFASALLGHGAMLAFVNVGSFCIAVAFFGVTLSFL
ncbi:APC family permease, partial [bacterium]|nr:APC family permease [bacterium]